MISRGETSGRYELKPPDPVTHECGNCWCGWYVRAHDGRIWQLNQHNLEHHWYEGSWPD